MKSSAEHAANIVMDVLIRAGFQAFLVGGCVRDLIMCVEPKDYDVCTNATPNQVMALFPNTVAVGASFGVVRIQISKPQSREKFEIECATFRADGEYTDGRRPDTVSFSKTLEEDVVRRDFTINGLAMDNEGKLVDLIGGLQDIQNRVIRAIGDPRKRIEEDSLRMLRAVRFAARFDYTIDFDTKLAIIQMAHTIHRVSQERITDEILKMMSGPRPYIALWQLDALGLLANIFPNFPMREQFELVARKLDLLKNADPMVGLVVLLGEFENVEFLNTLDRMKLSTEQKKIATTAFTFRGLLEFFETKESTDDATVIRFKRLPGFKEALEVFRIDCLLKNNGLLYSAVKNRILSMDAHPTPLITGRDLITAGYTPGPIFTTVLHELETLQLNGVINTQEQALNIAKVMIAEVGTTLQE
jgi:poly(A) polymerase